MPNQYLNSKGDFRKLIDCKCRHCGNWFTRRPSQIDQGGGKFCSNDCTRRARTGPLEQRFWDKVNKDGPVVRPELGPCWVWIAAHDLCGYGMITTDRRDSAHRVSWQLSYGAVPKGLRVLHRCDNPPCVRPDHLFVGTQKDNVRDMLKKGRQRKSSVSPEVVAEMRRLRSGGFTGRQLSNMFGKSKSHINKLIAGGKL